MRNLFKQTARKYYRRERGMAYNERGSEVSGPWRATSFVEAKIELGFHANNLALPSHDVAVIRDAFLEGRFAAMREIIKQYNMDLCFTITGAYGEVFSERKAMRACKQRFEGILRDLGETLAEYNERSGNNFRSEARAEMQIWRNECDYGPTYPGLDVHDTAYRTVRRSVPDKYGPGKRIVTKGQERVLVTEGCGCVHDTIAECFPEFKSLIPWHLNTMRSSEDAKAWLVEELPDSVLETVRALVLADDNAKASERAA